MLTKTSLMKQASLTEKNIKQRVADYGVKSLSDSELLFWCFLLLQHPDTKMAERQAAAVSAVKSYYKTAAGLEQMQYFTTPQWQALSENSEHFEAFIELSLRIHARPTPLLGQVFYTRDFGLAMQRTLGLLNQEVLYVVCLNTQNTIICQQEIFRGTLDAAFIHPREIMACVLRHHSARFILVHNHPSDVVYPSSEDIKLTKRIKACGDLVGIELLDHFIVSRSKHFSFAQGGLLQNHSKN